jgi:hypothetical protein
MRTKHSIIFSKSIFYYLFAFLLVIIFLIIRLDNISNSLEFFGDIGRDHLALLDWLTTGKIPLLGPGISYFSLHLPPIYFYLNLPVFIISGFSAYSTLMTLILLFVLSFLFGLMFLQKKEYKVGLLITAILITFQPLYILQTRLPWNPTFAAPFLAISIFLLLLLREKYSQIKIILFSICLSVSLGLSAQSVPPVLVIFITSMLVLPHKSKNSLYFLITTLFIFLPLMIFELRHGLFFISRFIANPITQPVKTDIPNKLSDLTSYIFGINNWDIFNSLTVGVIFMMMVIYFFVGWWVRKNFEINKAALLFLMFFCCVSIIYLLPFPAKEYDIFGATILFFSAIAFLPLKFSIPITGLLLILWINPVNFNNYFKIGHRTVAQMESCANYICNFERDPMYISVQAWYIYHRTPEYQFIFTKSGCKVNDITSMSGWSNKMIVIADNETYEHGKTAYNELTLFGKSDLEKEYDCGNKLKAYILKK